MCSHLCFHSCVSYLLFFFFFKQKTAYEMRISDWSSDVCSSDLLTTSVSTLPTPWPQRCGFSPTIARQARIHACECDRRLEFFRAPRVSKPCRPLRLRDHCSITSCTCFAPCRLNNSQRVFSRFPGFSPFSIRHKLARETSKS